MLDLAAIEKIAKNTKRLQWHAQLNKWDGVPCYVSFAGKGKQNVQITSYREGDLISSVQKSWEGFLTHATDLISKGWEWGETGTSLHRIHLCSEMITTWSWPQTNTEVRFSSTRIEFLLREAHQREPGFRKQLEQLCQLTFPGSRFMWGMYDKDLFVGIWSDPLPPDDLTGFYTMCEWLGLEGVKRGWQMPVLPLVGPLQHVYSLSCYSGRHVGLDMTGRELVILTPISFEYLNKNYRIPLAGGLTWTAYLEGHARTTTPISTWLGSSTTPSPDDPPDPKEYTLG